MQKKLIALAVAGLASTAAFAQSNVTVYGVADVSFENVKADSAVVSGENINGRNRVNTNSSLLGFKGSEDLGNGLKALFQFETQVDMTNTQAPNASGLTPKQSDLTSTGSTFGAKRDTFVALAGNFGTVLGGYVSTPYRSIVTGYDVVPGSAGVGNSNGVFGKVYGGTNLVFRTNAVAYATPTFSGFSGVIAYVPNTAKSIDTTTNGNSVDPRGWNLALNYANGGFKGAYSYLKLDDVGVGGLAGEDHRAHLLAASYDFGQGTTLVGMYQNFKGTVDTGAASADVKRNSYYLGLKHVLGANEFAVAYQKANKTSGDLVNDNTDANQWTLRYGYNFSKRTQAYAVYSRIDNKDNSNFSFGGGNSLGTVGAGSNPTAFGVGVRHSF
ncbi:MAG TPA: porin [Azospira sp.]|nr:porin [Azospira sp.]